MRVEERQLGKLTVSVEDAFLHRWDNGTIMVEVPVYYHTDSGVLAGSVWLSDDEGEDVALHEARFWANKIEKGLA